MTSLTHFKSGVAEVRTLLGVCETAAHDASKAERDNAVRRACVVLLVSHFESYLKAVAESFSDAVGSGNLESRQIPRRIREIHTFPKLREILDSENDMQRAALLGKLQPIMALWNESAKPPPGTLRSSVLVRKVTSAGSETIDEIFTLMGSAALVCDGDLDVTDQDSETLPVNIRLSLADVVKCRNDIAHGDSSRRPTIEDVERYLRFLEAMATRLDRKATALIELVSA